MLLGALVDAGADRQAVFAAWSGVGVDGYTLTFERVQRCGVAATWANVVVDEHTTTTTDRRARSASCSMPPTWPRVSGDEPRRSSTRSPPPKAAVHGIDPDDVEFHEVGAVDAIVDVVGIAAALEALAIDELVAGPVATGRGTIRAAHGSLPNPAPAVARLLASRSMPVIGVDTDLELATPTGVAALAALATSFGALPAMTVSSVGYGAGRADTAGRPNVVQVIVGEALASDAVAPRPGRAGRAARRQRRRRHRRGDRPHHRRPRRRRSVRRLGDTDRDEEGPPGPRRLGAVRPCHSSRRSPPSSSPRPAVSACGPRRSSAGRKPAGIRSSRSAATASASSWQRGASRSSTTMPPRLRRRSAVRCATCSPKPSAAAAKSATTVPPRLRSVAQPWARYVSAISAGDFLVASSCCATSASPWATASEPPSSGPTVSASRPCWR